DEDLNQQAQLAAQERLRVAESQNVLDEARTQEQEAESPVEAEEDQDETGIDAKDIELVMEQAGVSRGRAVKALKENDLDLVNIIM
ncbi:hypothetical protein L0F63_000152, partial [Massospora cicadina]